MEENNIVMENEINENLVPVDDVESVDDVSSGNSFNKGVAALVAGGVIGAVLIGRTVIKKVKAKKAAKAGEDNANVEEEPKPKEKKGLRLGKNKTLVIIDKRDKAQKKEEPAEEVEEE